jgi:uncharacterized membrane protein
METLLPEVPSSFRLSRHVLLLLLLIMVCGTVLRFAFLQHEALEGDEIFSRQVVLLSPANEIAAIRNDLVHPPLYYFLLQATTKIWGTGADGIRGFSLLCGIVGIGLIAFLGYTLPDSRFTGLLAAALLALNRTHLFYSQEARSYAWYTLLALLFALWAVRITRLSGNPLSPRHWVAGTLLMMMLVYTHYVGAIYVGCAVLAILLSRVPTSRRIAVFTCATIAALSFIPWLITIADVYKNKHGIGDNLDWQGHPDIYALKQIFASALGLLDIRGGTTLVLLVIALLILTVLLSRHPLRQSPIVLILLFLSILPPIIVFFLSRAPFNLPIFGLRHLLPSIPFIIVLCCYGLDLLAQRISSHSTLVLSTGFVLLLAITILPTFQGILSRPSRIPYDLVSKEVEKDRAAGLPAYATWFYGVGEPVNFYCAAQCVAQLPPDHQHLPSQIVVLFRPRATQEMQQYRQLQQDGFSETQTRYYTNGEHSIYGTTVAILRRSSPSPTPTLAAINSNGTAAQPSHP